MTKEQLEIVKGWLVENIFRDPDIMLSDSRYIEVYGDPGEHTEIDMCYVIASLYEVLHETITGEPYAYMFHWANKCGAWVDDDLFTKMIGGNHNGD